MEPWDGPASIAFTDGTRHRRGARSQRPAAVALLRHQGRPGDHGVRSRRARHSRRRTSSSRSGCTRAGSSWSTPRRAASSPTRRSRASSRARSPYARWLAENLVRIDDLPAGAVPAAARSRDGAAPPAARSATRRRTCKLLLAPMARDGRGADRLDGHRHAARGALRSSAAALRLLQAALRAGDQPAARRDPRGAGDVDGVDDRARGQPARAASPSRAARSRSSTRSSTTISSRSCATSRSRGFRSITLPMLLPIRRTAAPASSARWTSCAPQRQRGGRRRATRS